MMIREHLLLKGKLTKKYFHLNFLSCLSIEIVIFIFCSKYVIYITLKKRRRRRRRKYIHVHILFDNDYYKIKRKKKNEKNETTSVLGARPFKELNLLSLIFMRSLLFKNIFNLHIKINHPKMRMNK
jgi:hypothetical protein